jgi:photosystem II stability/assembly factor-like uncharacterized protein
MNRAKITLWIGTRKGAFVLRTNDRKRWRIEGPLFRGNEVNYIVPDPRDLNNVYAAVHSWWFGPHLHVSRDGGKTWALAEAEPAMRCVPATTLIRIWYVQPGHAEQPGIVWAGGEPGALFRSNDWGRTWDEVPSLTAHATRAHWTPAMGSISLHSIQCPAKDLIVAAVSVGGAYRSADGGANWQPFNGNVRADFLPENKKFPEVGQCVHKLLAHPADPNMLYQQNHCGVYRARTNAAKWTNISRGLPTRFGFALALPAAESDTLFTVPIESPDFRCNPDGRFRVACSRNGGKTWQLLTKGLPQRNAHLRVFRAGMYADPLSPAGVYVGTTGGTLFYSRDSGKKWDVLADYLPPIYSIAGAVR